MSGGTCQYTFKIGKRKGETCENHEKRGTPGKCWKHQGRVSPLKTKTQPAKKKIASSAGQKVVCEKEIVDRVKEIQPIDEPSTEVIKLDKTFKDSKEIDDLLEDHDHSQEVLPIDSDKKEKRTPKEKDDVPVESSSQIQQEPKKGKPKFSQTALIKSGFFVVCNAAEIIAKNYQLDIEGSTQALMSNEEISECLDEIAHDFELSADEAVDPYTTLMFLMGVTIFSQWQINTKKKAQLQEPTNGKDHGQRTEPVQFKSSEPIPAHSITPTKNPPPKAFVKPQRQVNVSTNDEFFKKVKYQPVNQIQVEAAKAAVMESLEREKFLSN
jgi:hypothetical protein